MIAGQNKFQSFMEALFNAFIGYAVAVASQYVIFPFFGIFLPPSAHMIMGLFFTVVSIARSFILRRIFNWVCIKGYYVKRNSENMETVTPKAILRKA